MPPTEPLPSPPIIGSRLVFDGKAGPFGNGTYLTMPSNCADSVSSKLHVDSYRASASAE